MTQLITEKKIIVANKWTGDEAEIKFISRFNSREDGLKMQEELKECAELLGCTVDDLILK